MKKQLTVLASIILANLSIGCARPATVASHTASARTDQTETVRNVAPAQSYATAVRTGVAYDICRGETIGSCYAEDIHAGVDRVYTDPATCKGERSCLERVCEDYAHMMATELHETPDSDGFEPSAITCVMAWSPQCAGYPEVESVRGLDGQQLCTVEVW